MFVHFSLNIKEQVCYICKDIFHRNTASLCSSGCQISEIIVDHQSNSQPIPGGCFPVPFLSTSQPSGPLAHLELVLFDDATWLQVLPDLVEDSQHGDVGLSGASRRTDEKVLVSVVGCLKNNGLDPVQSLHPFEHQLPNLRSKERRNNNNYCNLDLRIFSISISIFIFILYIDTETYMHVHAHRKATLTL